MRIQSVNIVVNTTYVNRIKACSYVAFWLFLTLSLGFVAV